jgi:hypothetical protein
MIGTPLNRAGKEITEMRIPMGAFTDAIRLPSAKFAEVGASVSGVVVEIGESMVPEFNDKGQIDGLKFDADGNTIPQVDVTIETDGKKVIIHTDGAIFYAIGRALAEIGADDLEPGDTLTVTYTGDGKPSAPKRNPPKQFAAVIVKG